MILNIAFLVGGLALLYYGGESLITGCLRIAQKFKISPYVIGATIMGFGTSTPELAVSVLATWKGEPELAMGNVIGSNIANVGLVLGLTALLIPLTMPPKRFRSETPPLLIATFLILFMVWDMVLSRWEGLLMLVGLVFYTWNLLREERNEEIELEDELSLFQGKGLGYQFLLVLAGLFLLILGAEAMVQGAVYIARAMEVSEWFIGISIVALGTSLPEIVSSLLSARKGHGEMALGNIIGSNIFNITMVLGTTSVVHPLHIQEPIHPDLLITTGITCLLIVLIKINHQLGKPKGVILLLSYVAYIGLKGSGYL